MALSPDGRFLATGGIEGIRLTDRKTGEDSELRSLEARTYLPLQFSSDGGRLVGYRSSDWEMYRNDYACWDVETGDCHPAPVHGLYLTAISPQGGTVAFYTRPKVTLWSPGDDTSVALPDAPSWWPLSFVAAFCGTICVGSLLAPWSIVCLILLCTRRPKTVTPQFDQFHP
jgi:WD40 repeat protein